MIIYNATDEGYSACNQEFGIWGLDLASSFKGEYWDIFGNKSPKIGTFLGPF